MHPIIASELSRQVVDERLRWAEEQRWARGLKPRRRFHWRRPRTD